MKIGRKVHILFAVIVLAVTAGTFAIFQYMVIPWHIRMMEDRALDMAYYVCHAAPMLTRDEQQSLLEKLGSQQRDLAYIEIIDKNGKSLVHNNPQRVGMVFDDPGTLQGLSITSGVFKQQYIRDIDDPDSLFHGERVLDMIIPYYDKAGHHSGAVDVGLSMQRVDAARRQYYLIVMLVGLLFSVMLLLAGRRIFKEIISPIQEIALATQELREGQFKSVSSLERADEIGDLAREFDVTADRITHLVGSLQSREKELEDYIISLEETKQALFISEQSLRRSNDELELRVKTRTLELEEINEELAREKECLAVTLKSIGDGVISTDINGRISLVNEAAEKILGKCQQELLDKDFLTTLLALKPKYAGHDKPDYSKLLTGDMGSGRWSYDMSFSVNGEERRLDAKRANINDREGKFAGMVWAIRDTTNKQKMEEELLKASKLDSLGVLAGGIAHDFNNLLTVIVGNLALGKMALQPENEVYDLLVEAEKASFQAKGLTQQLLTFARGGAPLRKHTIIRDLLRDSASITLSGSNVSGEIDIDEDLWLLHVDPAQISQVFNNLIINAVQAMPEGGTIKIAARNITLTDGEIAALPAGKYVRIAIRDQGGGIAENIQSRIFDPYFSTKATGSGLGLATSYSIIRKHEGYINLVTSLGEGTTFYVYLPASASGCEAEPKQTPFITHSRAKILVMDDDERIREVAGHILDSIGYTSDPARDGKEAVEMYRQALQAGESYDAVIIDLTIAGGMGGKETILKILEIDPGAKLIVSSGYANDPIMGEYQNWGLKGVIPKPYGLKELSETIASIVREEQG